MATTTTMRRTPSAAEIRTAMSSSAPATPLLTLVLALRQIHRLLSLLLRPILAAILTLLQRAWRRTEKFRDRCFYDFVVLLVNPYVVALVLFWPGWIVVGVVWWALVVAR
jgi:hypothetical protein